MPGPGRGPQGSTELLVVRIDQFLAPVQDLYKFNYLTNLFAILTTPKHSRTIARVGPFLDFEKWEWPRRALTIRQRRSDYCRVSPSVHCGTPSEFRDSVFAISSWASLAVTFAPHSEQTPLMLPVKL